MADTAVALASGNVKLVSSKVTYLNTQAHFVSSAFRRLFFLHLDQKELEQAEVQILKNVSEHVKSNAKDVAWCDTVTTALIIEALCENQMWFGWFLSLLLLFLLSLTTLCVSISLTLSWRDSDHELLVGSLCSAGFCEPDKLNIWIFHSN